MKKRVVNKMQWQPIETAPKDGTEILVFHKEAGVCAAFCPAEGFAWHCMDGSNTVIGEKSGASIPAMTSFTSPPIYWMPLPAPPAPPALAKYQPCGCVICTCEHETQCQGCGGHHCGTHPVGQFSNPIYETTGV